MERARHRFRYHGIRAKYASDTENLNEAAARLGHVDTRITKRVRRRVCEVAIPLRYIKRHWTGRANTVGQAQRVRNRLSLSIGGPCAIRTRGTSLVLRHLVP
jgi:hypothetical protein